jgi:hypothetical protein
MSIDAVRATRARLGYAMVMLPKVREVRVPRLLTRLVASPVHYLMQRKQLLGIRHCAEQGPLDD